MIIYIHHFCCLLILGGDEAFTSKITPEAGIDLLLDQRHLVIRGETASTVLKARALILKCFRDFFDARKLTEVTPPLYANN